MERSEIRELFRDTVTLSADPGLRFAPSGLRVRAPMATPTSHLAAALRFV
jgi:hypothetical protein